MRHVVIALCATLSALVANACNVPLAEDPSAIDSDTWAKMITDVGAEKTATQKMAKAFLFIKKGDLNVISHKNDLKSYISEFEDKLDKILHGKDGYSKPPLEMICDGLEEVQQNWPKFKEILEPATHAEYVFDANDTALMASLSYWSELLMNKLDAVENTYIGTSQFYSESTPAIAIQLAERQSMLTQRMSKDALFIGAGHNVQAHLASLDDALIVFGNTHQGLLKGIASLNVPPLRARCTIWVMRQVTDLWLNFRPAVQYILDTEAASADTLKEIEETNQDLLLEMGKAVALFAKDDDSTCKDIEKGLTFDLWANGINEAGRGQMFSQKSTRLMYQIAQPNPANLKIDQDELVDTLAVGLWTLNTLIEGSVALTVPALPTQVLVEQFVEARETWKKFQATLANNAQNLPISDQIVARVADLRETYWAQMAHTIDMYVDEAKLQAPNVHSEVIFIAGRQRSLQCKLASEALAVDLNCRPEHNRQLAAGSIKLWLEVHWKLLLGEKDENGKVMIKRTTNICMLDQMLTVIDSYARIRGITGLIMESNRDTSSKADLQSFHEIINAGYGIMNAAVEMYIADGGVCTLRPQPEEWDMVFHEISNLRALVEQVTKDFLFTVKGLNTTDGDINLHLSLAELRDSLHKLTYGNTAESIPTPPSQPAANQIFAITDAYTVLESLLLTAPDASQDDVVAVAEQSATLMAHVQTLMELYIDDAWIKDKTVQAARQNASGSLTMAVERAQKQAMLLQFQDCAPCVEQGKAITDTITFFEDTHYVLLHGNVAEADDSSRRLMNGTKAAITATVDNNLVIMLNDALTKFNGLKRTLMKISEEFDENGEVPSATILIEAADSAKAVGLATRDTDTVYSTSTRTTTSVPLDVLTPVPLTGDWSAGRTMRTAARVAEDIINYQQTIMPGFAIRSRFFDDMCVAQEGMRLVLQESASVTVDYVALGGVGCSEVCASAAFAAASMNLPFLSYECSSQALSSETEYPGFTRMGTPLTPSLQVLQTLVEQYGWKQVSVVSGEPTIYRPQVEYYQSGLLAAGVANAYYSSFERSVEETVAMAKSFVADKRRVILMIGDETFMRQVVCGTRVAGANVGITWLYEGILSNQWWTVDDAALIAAQPDCTGVAITESFQGAINFVGLGRALPDEEELPLDCFEGHTSTSFLELLDQHLLDGYPVAGDDETMVARPHMELRAHSADGVCALSKTMAYFLESHSVDDLRNPSSEFYEEFVSYLKTGVAFQGVSGWVNFTGNDKPESMAMKQVRGQDMVTIGMVFPNGSSVMDMNGGLANNSWTEAKADVEESFPWMVFKILTPVLCICCPALAGCIRQG